MASQGAWELCQVSRGVVIVMPDSTFFYVRCMYDADAITL